MDSLRGLERLIEQRIEEARRDGQFDDLPGAGKPLDLGGDEGVPAELRAAYRMLRTSGCLPREMEVKKELEARRAELEAAVDPAEVERLTRRVSELALQLSLLLERHRRRSR